VSWLLDEPESGWLKDKLSRRLLRRGLRLVSNEVDQYGPNNHMPYPVYVCLIASLEDIDEDVEDLFWVLVKPKAMYRIRNRYDWLDYRKEDRIPCLAAKIAF
jgi:hypothetical protein